jgi:hypothetical protein
MRKAPDFRGVGSALRSFFSPIVDVEPVTLVTKPPQEEVSSPSFDHALARVNEATTQLEVVTRLSAAASESIIAADGIALALERLAKDHDGR